MTGKESFTEFPSVDYYLLRFGNYLTVPQIDHPCHMKLVGKGGPLSVNPVVNPVPSRMLPVLDRCRIAIRGSVSGKYHCLD